MTLVEVAIGVALLGLVAATALATLMMLNKNAVTTRVMGNAREIVQRNIETAVGAPFNSTTEPAILVTTNTNGVVWDDDGGGDNKVTVYSHRDGTGKILGDLKRTVTAPNPAPPAGVDLRTVKFRLDYTLFGRPMNYEMTTIRAMDR